MQIQKSVGPILLKCSKLELENKLLKRLDIADDSSHLLWEDFYDTYNLDSNKWTIYITLLGQWFYIQTEVVFGFKNNFPTDLRADQNVIPFNLEKISKYSEEVQILPYRL